MNNVDFFFSSLGMIFEFLCISYWKIESSGRSNIILNFKCGAFYHFGDSGTLFFIVLFY